MTQQTDKGLEDALVVHYLRGGVAICGLQKNVPSSWEAGHLWSSESDDVTCKTCLLNLAYEKDRDIEANIQAQNDGFAAHIESKMTVERAREIWKLTRDIRNNVQDIAKMTYKTWGTDAIWTPPSNSVAGELLCLKAGEKLGKELQTNIGSGLAKN